MSGNPHVVWLCLALGMLLQLAYLLLPLDRGDRPALIVAALLGLAILGYAYSQQDPFEPVNGLMSCGLFTLGIALGFQNKLLPRLGEGAILVWTVVFIAMLAALGGWQSTWIDLGLLIGVAVILLTVLLPTPPFAVKVLIYGWFLLTVVGIGALQFRGTDFALIIDGRADQVNYLFAFIDGMAGAYIGVHASFLFELLPIPGKTENWQHFKVRWHGFLTLVITRFYAQRLSTQAALGLAVGLAAVLGANHVLGLIPDRLLAYLVLVGLPIAWGFGSNLMRGGKPENAAAGPTPAAGPPEQTAGAARGDRGSVKPRP